MSKTTRITGDYDVISSGDFNVTTTAMRLTGDLIVTGTTVTVNTTTTTIQDNIITLNDGEAGAGVTLGFAGIEIDSGSEPNAVIRFNESSDKWESSPDGIAFEFVGANDLINDLTPQLGGNLDVNNFQIVSAAGGDIVLTATDAVTLTATNGITLNAGTTVIVSPLALDETDPVPSLTSGLNTIYAVSGVTAGGSGIFFKSDAEEDELIAKRKAIIYSMVF